MDNMLIGLIVAILLTAVVAVSIYLYTDYKTLRQNEVWRQQATIMNFTH